MFNLRLVLAALFLFSMALLQEGCAATGIAKPNTGEPLVLVEGLCGNAMYYGFAGTAPASSSGFFKNGVLAARAFLTQADGKVLVSHRLHNLGTIRRIPRTKRLVYFSPRSVSLLQPRPKQCGPLVRKWLFVPGPGRVILTGGSHCALSADGAFAAFIVANLARGKASAQNVYLVRISDGRVLVLPTHRLAMGIAFLRNRLLVNTGGPSDRLWVVAFHRIANPVGMVILRRAAAPGRLVGVFGDYPVFESHGDNSLFIGGGQVSFQGTQIRDVACGRAGVLAVLADGRVMWWHAGKVKTILRVVPSQIAGMGANSRGLWVAERNGRLLLVNAEGGEKWFDVKI